MALTLAAIIGGSSILGGAISAYGANRAANTQAAATQAGITTQINELQNIGGILGPFWGQGQTLAEGIPGLVHQNQTALQNQLSANNAQLQGVLPGLTTPFNPTMAQLEATPGYQFTLQQGQQGVANAYSGQGLGAGVQQGATAMTPSGPGVKGAINYAEGLASTTYQQQFQNYLSQNSQLYNMYTGAENQMMNQTLAGLTTGFNMQTGGAGLGEQAGAAMGGIAQNNANSIAGLQSAGGAALAAGTQGAANAIGQGISGGIGGAASNYALINALGGGSLNSMFGSGGGLDDSSFTSP